MVDTSSEQERARVSTTGQRWRLIPARGPARESVVRHDLRTKIAVGAGRMAAVLSRKLGVGSGAMIGGRLALMVRPTVLRRLVEGRQVVMVTGTNGKTTTTRMVVEALRSRGRAVSNATGANMLDGHVAALMRRPDAPYAALEVDELHLAQATERFEPAVIMLLNLSRDQLDRVGEIRSVERSIRQALRQAPGAHVVANRDDPNIVSAAADHPNVTWVSGGSRWKHDALNCPRCGAFLESADGSWVCECGLARPRAQWTVTESGAVDRDGRHYTWSLNLPGHVNRINATFALAAALELGCDRNAAMSRVQGIDQANGRYGTVRLGGRDVRLLLAKNPASWLEMLDLVSSNDRALILAVNSREADGYDVSWLWDIDFEVLRARTVTVTGDRGLDLAVRLRYAGVHCAVAPNVESALNSGQDMPEVPEVIANYTAFRDLFGRSATR